ncbi:MAG: class I SAM-dependent methyltransferase [Chitinophagales bacterium]
MSENGIRCCVCGNSGKTNFSLFYEKPGYHVMQCAVCSFVFVPTYYRESISYTDYKDAKVADQVKKGNNWIKIQRHLLRFDLIKKYKKQGKVFDLGAGWGHFLLAGKQLGYDVYGIELSEQPALYAKNELGLPIDRLDFFAMNDAKKFDIITLWDVLEHIDEADKVIEKCNTLLAEDGLIVIQVPQIDSFMSKRFKETWKMVSLDHVNYFSSKTLPRLLKAKGFEVQEMRSSIELKLFLMYTVLPFFRKVFPKKKKANSGIQPTSAERQEFFNKFTNVPHWVLWIFVRVHNAVYKTLSFFRIGEEMIVVAKKK